MSFEVLRGRKKSVMQIYKNYLTSQGIPFREESFGLAFKYQGGNFIIADNNSDKQYFQLLMPGIYDVPPMEKGKVLEVINAINQELKCVKATLVGGTSVWLATEIFIDNTPDIEDFFDRLLQILHSARMKFSFLMQ